MEWLSQTEITPDQVVFWRSGFVSLNATLVFTWAVMALLVLVSWLATRRLSTGPEPGRLQGALELFVATVRSQIRSIGGEDPDRYLPFVGTLFLFIAAANLLAVVPGYVPPTGSLSTAAALALCVFAAVPAYGVARAGPAGYLRHYIEPTPLMLPFNVLGELSRTLALAVRLFGNVMSGVKVAGILLAVIPLVFPVLLHLLGLLTGMIQAYIFAVLAMVYIASASRTAREDGGGQEAGAAAENENPSEKGDSHG